MYGLFPSSLKHIFHRLLFVRAVLGSRQHWAERTEILCTIPVPKHTQSVSLSNSHPRVVHLLQPVNLQWHIIVSQSLEFTEEFTITMFYGFWKIYNDVDLPLQYYTQWFHCSGNSLCIPYFFLSNAWQLLIILLSP